MGTGLISRPICRQRNVDKHISEGKCRRCSKPAKKGGRLCQYHLDYYKKRRDSPKP